MAINETAHIAVLTRLLNQFRSDLEPHVQVLNNVKDVTDPSAPDRRGAFGKIVDLDWEGKQCVGKELHEIFFEFGSDVGGMRARLQKFCKEIKMMSKLKHDNIVSFFGIYYKQLQSASVALPVLVMEKMEYSLRGYIETTQEGAIADVKIAEILCDVARGLVYLHEGCEEPLAHRDLSSNNILLTSQLRAKIADFGESRALDRPEGWNSSAKLTKLPGTQAFMPPETWEDPPSYTTAVDIFSFGCVIIHLVTWQWPQPDGQIRRVTTTSGDQVRQIISELKRRQKWISMFGEDHPLLPIVKQCLQDKINNRPKCKELLVLCEEAVKQYKRTPERNIVAVGGSHCGKSTLLNRLFGHDIFSDHKFQEMVGKCEYTSAKMHMCGKEYNCNFVDTHTTSTDDIKAIIPDFRFVRRIVNLILFVIRKSCLFGKEIKNLEILWDCLNKPFSVSALVITHCEFLNDKARADLIMKVRSHELTKNIAASMGKGIYTVGFPDLTDTDNDIVKVFIRRIYKDRSDLLQLVVRSSGTVDVPDVAKCSVM